MAQIKVNAMLQAKLIGLLLEGLYTTKELSEQTGLHRLTVCEYLQALRREPDCPMRIVDWGEDSMGRRVLPIYRLGDDGPDAIKPAPRAVADIKREAARRKADARLLGLQQPQQGRA